MLFLYRLLTQLVYFLVFPFAQWKMERGFFQWRDRLGWHSSSTPCHLWLHASSVGEVKVISYLLHYLRKKQPELKAMITVMTTTGYRAAGKIIGENDVLHYLPLDCLPAVRRTLDAIQPQCIVIAETEIWPNLVCEAYNRQIPIVQVNGRMSERAFQKYRWVQSAMQHLFDKYDRFYFKTETDAKRYQFFGVPDQKSEIIGDMKFDAPMLPHSAGRKAEIRYRAGVDDEDFLIVAGSTRPGEEEILLQTYQALTELQKEKKIRLIIAPRHIERIDEIKQLCINANLTYSIYEQPDISAPIILVDRMGILNDLYGAADIAFVGGTLVDIGGHNILEPVWTGTPVLFGPYTSNVEEASQYIIEHNYGIKVLSIEQLTSTINAYLTKSISFAERTEHDMLTSPTATAGNYILSKISHV